MPHFDDSMMITCWAPLVDADASNGCLHVCPYRFGDGPLRHWYPTIHGGADYLEIALEDFPAGSDREPVMIPMRAGDVLLLHNQTPHMSGPNDSDTTRWSMDLRYGKLHGEPNNATESPEDYTEDRDPFSIARAPREADFVLCDTRQPEREVRTGAEFLGVRQRWAAKAKLVQRAVENTGAKRGARFGYTARDWRPRSEKETPWAPAPVGSPLLSGEAAAQPRL